MLSLLFWYALDPNLPGMQFTEYRAWAPSLGIAYHVGADGLGVLMLVLSALLVVMSLVASWANEKLGRVYFALVLFLEAGLFGTFTALNFVHWFLYWELSLIPAFFLVRLWGGPLRATRGECSSSCTRWWAAWRCCWRFWRFSGDGHI